jgi:glycosyltransferase involved in cell wall biosynthesis
MVQFNIAMVAACPFPANRGTPSRILRMSEALARRGHKVHVVTYHFGEDIKTEGISIHRIPKVTGYHNFSPGPTLTKLSLLDCLLFFKLRSIIKTKNIDLIHAHHFEGALLGYAVRAIHGIPVIYDAHTTLAGELLYYRRWNIKIVSTFLDFHVPKWADFMITVSEELKEEFCHFGISNHKIEVIPTGINPEAFAQGNSSKIEKKYHLGTSKVVAYTGSLVNYQGIEYLIRAMSFVFKELGDTILLLVGSGNIKEYINKCNELGIQDKVIFAGPRPFSEIPDYLAAADVTVNPRINCPGMPQKLTNYMMARKAIVSFEGSAKFLSHGDDGLVVQNGDIEQMANSIITLLKNVKFREKLGMNAKRKVLSKYSWDLLSKKIEDIYSTVLNSNPVISK